MSKPREKYRAGRTVKTSISLSETVNTWAEELALKKGFDNFSQYVADLIRRDKERDEQPASPAPGFQLNAIHAPHLNETTPRKK